jgi:hypothetical protein
VNKREIMEACFSLARIPPVEARGNERNSLGGRRRRGTGKYRSEARDREA